jgi:hypothetical protein
MAIATAPVQKRARQEPEPEAKFFQGAVGARDFKASFVTHDLKQGYWLLEGTQRVSETSKNIIIFKYLFDRTALPSGRYTLWEDVAETRFSVIYMELGGTALPAYTAVRGTVEFFHDPDTNHVNGALDVYYKDVGDHEVRVQILFSE